MPTGPIPLDLLSPDEEGVIVEMEGEPNHLKRLEEIGIRVGRKVRMISQGCPCMICIDGRRLSLRIEEDAEIYVATESE